MAVVNSEQEAENLRSLYFEYGPAKVRSGTRSKRDAEWYETTHEWYEETTPGPTVNPPTETPTPEPADAKIHIGFHDIFIEGEYLTVRSK